MQLKLAVYEMDKRAQSPVTKSLHGALCIGILNHDENEVAVWCIGEEEWGEKKENKAKRESRIQSESCIEVINKIIETRELGGNIDATVGYVGNIATSNMGMYRAQLIFRAFLNASAGTEGHCPFAGHGSCYETL